MSDDLPPIPGLLRDARRAYGTAIRAAIAERGLPALPRDGAFILGGLHQDNTSFDQLLRLRGPSMERHHTVTRLIEDGYLTAEEESLELTELGDRAAHVVYEVMISLEEALRRELGEAGLEHFYRGLELLIEQKERIEDVARK